MGVRIAALGVPGFMHGGLEVGAGWRVVADLDERQRAALREYHGRFIRVHPEDRERLRELGLEFAAAEKPLVDAKKSDASGVGKNKDPKPDVGGKTDAKKSDANSAGK